MKVNYNNKTFRVAREERNVTHFKYKQDGNILSGEYSGGGVEKGTLIGKINDEGVIEMHYQHLNAKSEFKLGKCISVPTILADGRIELYEKYESVGVDPTSKGEIKLIEVLE